MQVVSSGLRRLQAYNDREHLETPYVAKLHRFTALAPTLPVFTFEHPNPEAGTAAGPDNARETALRFERPGAPAAVCHGFAGYFDAQVPRVPAHGVLAACHVLNALSEPHISHVSTRFKSSSVHFFLSFSFTCFLPFFHFL